MTILLRNLPLMARQLLEHAIAAERDVRLHSTLGSLLQWPDAIIVGTIESDPSPTARRLLGRWPRSAVVMLSLDAGHADLYELRPHKIGLGMVTPRQLIEAIRVAVRTAA